MGRSAHPVDSDGRLALLSGGCILHTSARRPTSRRLQTKARPLRGRRGRPGRQEEEERNAIRSQEHGRHGKLKKRRRFEQANRIPNSRAQNARPKLARLLFASNSIRNHLEAQRHPAQTSTPRPGDYDRPTILLKKAYRKHPKDANLWYDLRPVPCAPKELTEKASLADPGGRTGSPKSLRVKSL